MRYKVPRYIEYEAKILGPITFKQFISLFPGGFTVLFLFFLIDNTFFFLFLTALIASVSLGITFGSVEGKPIYVMIYKYILFSIGSSQYIWEKKDISPRVVKKEEEEEEEDKTYPYAMKKRSRLQDTSRKIEIS